ncbi:MAG: DNA repair protein RecO [Acidobacteriota bacterium]|nr:DNA repair protein RecO [Acidobacteriota bacterium]
MKDRRADKSMALHESEAIILQSYSLGEADRLVSFLSRAAGRMRGVAAGARKPRSKFGSTLERLSYVRIWYFENPTRELVRIRQCEMIESFLGAFGEYASSVALSILSEVSQAVLPDREASDANFRLLLLTAQTVKRTGKADLPLAYFALWTVKLGGWLAPLDRCGFCGAALAANSAAYVARGGSAVACGKCRRGGMRAISPAALALARQMLAERLDKLPDSVDAAGIRAAREVIAIMLDIIEQQIDRKLTSRELLEPTA